MSKDSPKDKHLVTQKSPQRALSQQEQAVLEKILGNKYKKYMRVALAALGSLPWVGSVISAANTYAAEKDQSETNQLLFLWIQQHEDQLRELKAAFTYMFERFESFGDRINERIESEDYLLLIRKTFRQWDRAETKDKKDMFKKLITNAGGMELCPDDLVRLFLDWIDKYHEFHFMVIREIYKKPEITRGEIWDNLRDDRPEEDSAEADLFKLLIRNLSTGGVIRQSETSRVKDKSAFDDTDPYVLTQLGGQFVHYVMTDLAPQIES